MAENFYSEISCLIKSAHVRLFWYCPNQRHLQGTSISAEASWHTHQQPVSDIRRPCGFLLCTRRQQGRQVKKHGCQEQEIAGMTIWCSKARWEICIWLTSGKPWSCRILMASSKLRRRTCEDPEGSHRKGSNGYCLPIASKSDAAH